MNQVIFVVDESGAKGYSTNTENEPGDLGVMAGYLIPKNCLSLVKSELDIIRSNFTEEGKIHITDLSPRQQGELRNIIFNYFNIETKEFVKGNIAINISSDIDSFEDFAEISYSIACEDSSLTLAADVLVNSVHHHLKSLQSKIAGAALNTAYSITNHQLSSLVYGVLENSEGNDFSDAMFTHPIQKSRRNQ